VRHGTRAWRSRALCRAGFDNAATSSPTVHGRNLDDSWLNLLLWKTWAFKRADSWADHICATSAWEGQNHNTAACYHTTTQGSCPRRPRLPVNTCHCTPVSPLSPTVHACHHLLSLPTSSPSSLGTGPHLAGYLPTCYLTFSCPPVLPLCSHLTLLAPPHLSTFWGLLEGGHMGRRTASFKDRRASTSSVDLTIRPCQTTRNATTYRAVRPSLPITYLWTSL